jgi:hypothetical protein
MADQSNIKNFTVTGTAAQSLMEKMEGGKSKRQSRKQQRGGTSPGTLVQLNATRAPGSPDPPEVKPIETTGLKPTAAPVLTGGNQKHVKVILAPKKKTQKVVFTKPKKKIIQAVALAAANVANKTRKVAKKIRMSISSLSNRMTRAQKIRKESKEMNMEDIKKTLKQANLIKETTKAPDNILRQMYADYLLLKNRAL